MEDDSPRTRGRRQVLATMAATTGITGLAGCSALWDQTGATDVIVHNAARSAKTISVTITANDAAEPHTSRSLEVDSGDSVHPVNESKLPTNSEYTVEVAVENGPSETFDWSDPSIEQSPLWVFVDSSQNIKFLLQAG